ncbi:hypothetical protein BD560DRAFT_386124 [Blakeslea trispora]|nr:hypothetical protein BD560DRAFT_386124 [Blakeslea trispora]
MEKFSRWRDASTGIQPFLPPVVKNILKVLSNVVYKTIGSLQAVIKLVLILLVSLIYILSVPLLGLVWTPIPFLKRLWTRLLSIVLLRSALMMMGFFYIKTETVSLRKSRDRTLGSSVKHGDLIVANWTSYIDIIYLAYRFSPVFTQVFMNTSRVKVVSFWEAIQLVGQSPQVAQNEETLYSLDELTEKAKQAGWGPVVVFPEGTTTNGRALLKFSSVLDSLDLDVDRIHLLAFKYEYHSIPPTFTVGNIYWHLFQLCSQFYNTMIIKSLSQGELQSTTAEALHTSLGHLSKLRKTNLGMSDKQAFLDYYYQGQKKKKAA